jgi:TPR repeat protein
MRDFKKQVINKIDRFKLEVLFGNAALFFDQATKLNATGHREEALELYQAAAINGHPDAAYALGRFYEPQDSNLALAWHKKAVSLGNILSSHYIVRQSIALVDSEKDMKDTVVEQKLLPAKTLLVNIISRDLSSNELLLRDLRQDFYDLGQRFEKRLLAKNEAFDCYKLAARHGNIDALEALYNLGEGFEKQSGISLQNDNAVTCFGEAANLGHKRSQFKLGWLYWRNQDLSSATPWLQTAAEQEEANACNLLGIFYHEGKGRLIQNSTYAKELYKVAAKKGEIFARFNLVLMSSSSPDITPSEQQLYLNNFINYVYPFLNHFNPLLDHHNFDAFYQKRFYEMNQDENCYYGMHADLAALIGIAYTTGIGTLRDGTLARQWLGAASRMGCWHIQPLLYSLYHPNKKPSSECILF